MSTTHRQPAPILIRFLPKHAAFHRHRSSARTHTYSSKEEYDKLCARAAADPEAFWADIARELHWFEPWNKVLEWNVPWAKWFLGGKINLSYNCLDRHVRDLAQEQGRHHLGERARRSAHLHLSAIAERGVQVRQRAEDAGHQVRRSRRHLHGHVSRTADRHAGVRAHRRGALGHLRRILGQCAGRPHHRPGSRRRHHAGQLLSPRRRSEAESHRG